MEDTSHYHYKRTGKWQTYLILNQAFNCSSKDYLEEVEHHIFFFKPSPLTFRKKIH